MISLDSSRSTHKGTTVALTKIIGDILAHIDTTGIVRGLLVDFSKAFDRMLHSKIIEVMRLNGATEEFLIWLSSYLRDRFHRTIYNNKHSSWALVESEGPQGGVQSPCLFAFYISSLSPISRKCQYIKFADDLTILNFITNPDDGFLQQELTNVNK